MAIVFIGFCIKKVCLKMFHSSYLRTEACEVARLDQVILGSLPFNASLSDPPLSSFCRSSITFVTGLGNRVLPKARSVNLEIEYFGNLVGCFENLCFYLKTEVK